MSTMMVDTITLSASQVLEPPQRDKCEPMPGATTQPMGIHDASRAKIVIQTRCKEYAKKRPATLRPRVLDGSTSGPSLGGSKLVKPALSGPVGALDSNGHRRSFSKAVETRKGSALGTSSSSSSSTSPTQPPERRSKVHSGRIEKPLRSVVVSKAPQAIAGLYKATPPVLLGTRPPSTNSSLNATRSLSSVVSVGPPPPTQDIDFEAYDYPCTSRNPEECAFCRWKKLADKFCNIVVARKERLGIIN